MALPEATAQFAVECNTLENVEAFYYLIGNTVTRHLEMNICIGCFRKHDITATTKITVYKTAILSTLLYGSEACTLYRRHIKQLEKPHQWQLRKLLRIRWDDFVCNQEVLRRTKLTSIELIIRTEPTPIVRPCMPNG